MDDDNGYAVVNLSKYGVNSGELGSTNISVEESSDSFL